MWQDFVRYTDLIFEIIWRGSILIGIGMFLLITLIAITRLIYVLFIDEPNSSD